QRSRLGSRSRLFDGSSRGCRFGTPLLRRRPCRRRARSFLTRWVHPGLRRLWQRRWPRCGLGTLLLFSIALLLLLLLLLQLLLLLFRPAALLRRRRRRRTSSLRWRRLLAGLFSTGALFRRRRGGRRGRSRLCTPLFLAGFFEPSALLRRSCCLRWRWLRRRICL